MNSKNSILLVDPDFDVSSADNCDLLIKVSSDNFSYAIVDGTDNRVVVLYDQQDCKDVIAELSRLLTGDHHLAIPFKTVKASVYTCNSIAIPNELFDVENLNVYAKFFAAAQSEQLHLQKIKGQEHTSIFNLDHQMEDLLITRFGISKIYDHTAPLLALATNTAEKQLTLDFTARSFSAVLTLEGKLVFENLYETDDAEEFNYYLALIVQQLRIDSKTTSVILSGIIHEDDKKFEVVKNSFREVKFSLPNKEKLMGDILNDMPEQYYSTLLALQLCE